MQLRADVDQIWTLQEALAPSRCEVLFSWTRGTCMLQAIVAAYVQEVVPGQAAMSNMRNLLNISVRGEYYLREPDGT